MWPRIRALARKEFLALLRDKVARMTLIVPPLLQLIVFGYAATFNIRHIPYAVYNQDGGEASRQLLARFQGSSVFREVAVLTSDRQIAPMIDDKRVLLVVHVSPQFSRDLMAHRPGRVQVIIDGRNSNTAALASNYVNQVVEDFDTEWAADHHWRSSPARLVVRSWFNPDLLSSWFIVPGIVGLLTLVVTLLTTGLSVARERESGTFDQLLVTPLNPVEILIGKSIPGFVIGVVEATLILAAAVFWFDVPFMGSLMALYLGLLLFLFSGIGIGLMISSLSVTQQQGALGVFLFMVPAVILSGFATPIANMPLVVQYVTYLDPLRYFLVILRGTFLEGDGAGVLGSQYAALVVLALASMTVAAWLFRHRTV
ncbi:MAG: ABC transporter permease [Gammaproteobacteria bacterium]|nr:ABC transporter permease [Gammaproteobacteria bacterium]